MDIKEDSCSREIEERWLLKFQKPTNSAPCHKCGGLAIRLPLEKFKH